MRVTAVETLRLTEHPEILWVEVHTDEHLVGLGETMPRPGPVEAVVHDVLAPLLIGQPVAPVANWERAFASLAYHGYAGAELRALSAVDIALWDLLGQRAGRPLAELLGGPCRERVRLYNTCVSHGGTPDRERFLDDPGALAVELADEGYPVMKIWPFDDLALASRGQRVDPVALAGACRILEAIREAAGTRIQVAIEAHSCWSLPAATALAHALEEFEPAWLEDPLPATDPGAWARLRAETTVPVCGSERAFTRFGLEPFLTAGAVDIVKQDLAWTGGVTEMLRVAAAAQTRALPVAPHNCHGPVAAAATVAVAAVLPNLFLCESVRSFARGFFADLAVDPVVPRDGYARPDARPGVGVRLRPEVAARARRRRSDTPGTPVGWAEGDPWARGLGERV